MVIGFARVSLSQVVASPKEWGSKRVLQLSRHGLKGLKDVHTGAESAELEVQLFLSTVSAGSGQQQDTAVTSMFGCQGRHEG